MTIPSMATRATGAPPGQTPTLLRASRHQRRHRIRSLDCQRRFRSHTAFEPGCDALMLLTDRADQEADQLCFELRDRLPIFRIDIEDLPDLDFQMSPAAPTVTLDGWTFRPAVIWIRHFRDALPPPPADRSPIVERYVDVQVPALRSIIEGLPAAVHVNPPATIGGLDRVAQLRLASRAGLEIPTSIVSANPERAVATLLAHAPRSDTVVLKPLGPHFVRVSRDRSVSAFARILGVDAAAALPPEPCPLLWQKYVAHVEELRLYVVGGARVAYRIDKSSPEDPWTDARSVTVRPAQVPPYIDQSLSALLGPRELMYASVDLLVAEDGTVTFLEINVEGDWLSFESKAGDRRVSEAVTAMLLDLGDAWGMP